MFFHLPQELRDFEEIQASFDQFRARRTEAPSDFVRMHVQSFIGGLGLVSDLISII